MPTRPAQISRQDKLAAIREKLKHTDMGTGSGTGFWSPPEGKTTIRILPPVGEMEFFFQTVGRHQFPGKDGKSCYCPKFTSEDALDCPVCESVDLLYKSGDKSSKAMASELKVRRSYWMNVVVRGKRGKDGNQEEDTGPVIYTPGVIVFNYIAGLVSDPDYGDIYDVEDGLDIVIDRNGTGIDTKYSVSPRRNSGPLSDDPELAQKWLDEAKDLSYVELTDDPEEDKELQQGKVLWVSTYDRIIDDMGLGDGVELEADAIEEEDEDEPVAPKRPAKPTNAKASAKVSTKPTRKAADVDEDEEDADAEVEPPAKREVANRLARRSLRR